ncbi:methyltransferase [Sandarakinorhabdus oryzae]|uniref:methyltransferase n=1 Tax=Sandarakinorhabdus oryzae TaxID=2675220 RepID=UPI0018CC1C74|nr:methyltransferase [Sandarakinorhabdus oryzae]
MADTSASNSWKLRWLNARNRVLANPAFQRFAMRNPLMRRTARYHANAMFVVITGFVQTKALTATVDAGVIRRLSEGPASTGELAQGAGLSLEAMQRLLGAAKAIDLVELAAPDLWVLGQRGAALSSNQGALAMIEHHKLFYDDLADPLAMLKGGRGQGRLAAFWTYAPAAGRGDPAAADAASWQGGGEGAVAPYSALMAASQPMVAEQVLDAYDFSRHQCLMDVGGGHGAFLAEVAQRHPRLSLILFDLPAVVDGAKAKLAGRGLSHVSVRGGSFRDDPLPQGADVISLVRICHDHDDAVVRALLKKAHAALPPGGRLLIAEPMAGTPGAEVMGDAYFGLYLWAMGSGRPRTPAAYLALLAEAGFASAREVGTALPMVTRLIVAER